MELWHDYQENKREGSNFYHDRLKELFFNGFNNPDGFSNNVIGDGPFLNGGLFEPDESFDSNLEIIVPDSSLKMILFDLFSRFNFTVTESTPLDQEVEIDLEMLGTIFEELVTERNDTGAFYTPKPIVSFMCREGIKKYLMDKVPSETETALFEFVENQDSSTICKCNISHPLGQYFNYTNIHLRAS